MKIINCLLVFLLSISIVPAQQKMLTMEDAMVKFRTTLAPENLKQLQFIKGSNDYLYTGTKSGRDSWITGSSNAIAENTWLSLSTLNSLLRSAKLDSMKTFPVIKFNGDRTFNFSTGQHTIIINASNILDASIQVRTIEPGYTLLETNDQITYAALLKDDNLYVTDFVNSNKVTSDGNKNIVYGQSVHREEFGITKGTFWSNKGNQLAFYKMDQGMVTDYPIIDWTQRPAKAVNIKYPMAGDKSHIVTVGIYNALTRAQSWLKTDEHSELYLTNIAWSPDDKYVFVAELNRQQNHMKLNQYEAATGNFVKTLFEEKDDKYVEPLVPMLFVTNNPGQFIWQSNRDGWNHLYLYDVNGNLQKQLTKGNWSVTDVQGFDTKGNKLFYVSTAESPITRNLYSIELKSGKIERITQGEGTHITQLSDDGSTIIDVMSNSTTARLVNLIDLKTKKQKTLLTAANPLKDFALTNIEIFKLKSISGDDLYCRLYKPINFDAQKKYPVIVYWYGGPHTQLINNAWNGGAGDYWFQYMAERGFIVFSLDTRGSGNRGKAFEQSMFRKLGDVQMEDMMVGVNYLKSQSYVNYEKMGLFGWSFGGFMTTNFMLSHPGIFKAAVAGGPVINWKYYEIMYTERYMDTPQENPDGYAATDLTKKVDQLKGKLLLIHGLQDPVVVQQNSVNFVRAAIDKGIQVDYMIYPGHEHNVLGKDRAHLYQKVTDYLMEYLE